MKETNESIPTSYFHPKLGDILIRPREMPLEELNALCAANRDQIRKTSVGAPKEGILNWFEK